MAALSEYFQQNPDALLADGDEDGEDGAGEAGKKRSRTAEHKDDERKAT